MTSYATLDQHGMCYLMQTKGYSVVEQKMKKWKCQLLSCVWLCNPMDCSPPGSSVYGIIQARILEWVAIPFHQGIFPTQGSNLGLLNCRQILYLPSHKVSLAEKRKHINLAFLSHFLLPMAHRTQMWLRVYLKNLAKRICQLGVGW